MCTQIFSSLQSTIKANATYQNLQKNQNVYKQGKINV